MTAGYCWPQSVLPGEIVTVFCHTESLSFHAEVVRSGTTEKKVFDQPSLPGVRQSMPQNLAANGCAWQPSFEIEIQPEWPSGFYLVRLTDSDGVQAEAFFVVRSVEPQDAMLVLATSTWSAYNDWGGPNFYVGGGNTVSAMRPLPKGMLYQAEPGRHRISKFMERTAADIKDVGDNGYENWFLNAGWANWECLFARWAEAEGIKLGYAISQDLERDPDLLTGYPAYISVGHDEYWSAGMRDTVENYVDAGGNAAFFSGNTAFWQARFENDNSRVVSYKFKLRDDPEFDPEYAPNLSTMWSDPLLRRPENLMTGVSFTRGGYSRVPNSPPGTGGYTICRPDHWAFESLSLEVGEVLGAEGVVVGYECDGCEIELVDGLPTPTGRDGSPVTMEILGTAPAHLWETSEVPAGVLDDDYVGELNWVAERIAGADTEENRQKYAEGHAVLGTFKRGKGEVFTTGCTDWAYGLDQADVSTVTRNVMQRFLRRK